MNKPEFKNWFYVYKNYTVDDAYKQILLENYLTEVKHVDKVHYSIDFESEGAAEEEKNKEDEKEKEQSESTTTIEITDKEQEDSEKINSKNDQKQSFTKYDGSKDVQSALTANPILDRDSKGLFNIGYGHIFHHSYVLILSTTCVGCVL